MRSRAARTSSVAPVLAPGVSPHGASGSADGRCASRMPSHPSPAHFDSMPGGMKGATDGGRGAPASDLRSHGGRE